MRAVVYILFSEKLSKFYIGFSENLQQRIEFHNSSQNLKWTKAGAPWNLYFLIDCSSKSQAMAIEKYIKKQKSKQYILDLKNKPDSLNNLMTKFSK